MDEKNQRKIRIEKEEDLVSIIERIKKIAEKDIILIVPNESAVLQSVINLKLLKKTSEELGKSISIIKTNNESGGRSVFSHNAGAVDLAHKTEHEKGNGMKVKMMDIIKRTDHVANVENIRKKESVSFEKGEERADLFRRYNPSDKMNESALSSNSAVKKVVLLPSIIGKLVFAFISIAIVVGSLILYFTLPKVEIKMKLIPKALGYDLNLNVDSSMDKIDVSKNKIPGKEEEVSGNVSETFPTTGKRRDTEKASGKITIYNEFSSVQQQIVKDTRFLSKEGLIFKINEPIIIPGFTRVEGKDIPGEVIVAVSADKDGDKYNIGATTFTLPGFQGSARYSGIYARSTQAMAGGIDKEVLFVTEGDYVAAKEKLVKLAKEKNDQSIQAMANEENIILDKTRKEKEVKVASGAAKIGDVTDSFIMTVSAKESILAVNKKDINEFVDWKISSEKDGNVEVLDNSRNYEVKAVEKDKDGNIILPINIKQNVVAKIDVDKMKKELYNKNEKEVKEYFKNMKEISSGTVTFSWTNRVPSSNDKISITIEK